jgi:hypothetical protein
MKHFQIVDLGSAKIKRPLRSGGCKEQTIADYPNILNFSNREKWVFGLDLLRG